MSVATVDEGFRQSNVLKVVGITYRQLDYWARTKLVTPTIKAAKGSGSQRLYSFSDVVELRIIKKLLDAGVSLPKIRKALTYVREDLKQPLHEVTIVSDGRNIHACISPNEIVDLLNSGQGVFAISLGPIQDEMEGTISRIDEAGAKKKTKASRESDRSEATV